MILEFSRTWLPYIYLYSVGGFIFFTGMVIVLRSGSLKKQNPKHRFWYHILIFGFFYYLFIHGAGIQAALGNYLIMFLNILAIFSLLLWTLISSKSDSEKNSILKLVKYDELLHVVFGVLLLFILIVLKWIQ
tara:strand:+ start:55816 stop:56211 length:396 start_codon:yes stop_codon:yes gene_type:complete